MDKNFKKNLYDLLKKDTRLRDEEKKELNETLLKDLIDKLDEKIIELLLSGKETKEKFFIKVKDVFVLKQNELKFFIDENKLDNSYTQYQNKIGLRVGNKLLSERDEVVLDWPFKDCVLEGGMTKEDQKRNEIFFNEVLAKDERDRLFDPKALVNWKRYTAKGEEKVKELKRDKDDTIRENLIIKGNNLLALHSLKEQFTGKVKLIYIDPPYYFKDDKPEDTFKYNTNFKLSSWLTFMNNRLKVAKELLCDDGVIFVQIKDDGMAHLKLLMDEIFEEGFVNCIAVKMSEATGVKMSHAQKRFPNIKEYILFYKKSNNFKGFYRIDKYENKEWDRENNIFLENFTKEQRQRLVEIGEKEEITESDVKKAIEILSKVKRVSLSEKLRQLPEDADQTEWLFENSYRIIKTAGSSSLAKQVLELDYIPNQDISAFISRGEILFYYITDFNRETRDPRLRVIFADENIWKNPCDFWQDIKTTGAIARERGVQLSGGKKPEKLIHRIIDMTTNENDIVLDYHSGSGTTAGVAHKMKRQWITCEQFNDQIELNIAGMRNVINGDQTGISKSVGWKSGGDFIYLELAKWNEEAKEKILEAESFGELEKLFDELYERYFLNYNVKIKEFKEKMLKEEQFKKLGLGEQKKLFVEMLDMNQMYVNFSERNDIKYSLSKEDIVLSEEFYNQK